MNCQFCQTPVNPRVDTTCPECGFPVNAEDSSYVAAAAATVPSRQTQLTHSQSLRPGSICLTKQNEVLPLLLLLLVFCIDVSGSMVGRKIKEAIRGLMLMKQSLFPLGDKCQMAIVEFNEAAKIAHPLTRPALLEGQPAISEARGGTNIGAGLRLGGKVLKDHVVEGDAHRVLVLLSDGEDTCQSSPVQAATDLKAEGSLIITIGYGKDADHDMLRSIASSPDLCFAKGATGNELETFLKTLGGTMTASIAMGESLDRSLRRLD